jgi:hypothetical protein
MFVCMCLLGCFALRIHHQHMHVWCCPAVDVPFLKEEGSNHLEGGYALVSVPCGHLVWFSITEGCRPVAVLCVCNVTRRSVAPCQQSYCCAQIVVPCLLVDCACVCCWLQHLPGCG